MSPTQSEAIPPANDAWRRGARAKRVADVVLAIVLGVLTSPAWLAVAVLLRVTSSGSVLYRLRVMGRDGQPFEMLKFRTMVPSAEALLPQLLQQNSGSGPMLKLRDDPRITPIGRWLRRTSLDELPQFWNVLRGEMSIVGPRPLAVTLYDARYLEAPYRRRLDVQPGITGAWQVSSRSQDFEECCRLDIRYIDEWSLALDMRILAQTFTAVIGGRGAA